MQGLKLERGAKGQTPIRDRGPRRDYHNGLGPNIRGGNYLKAENSFFVGLWDNFRGAVDQRADPD